MKARSTCFVILVKHVEDVSDFEVFHDAWSIFDEQLSDESSGYRLCPKNHITYEAFARQRSLHGQSLGQYDSSVFINLLTKLKALVASILYINFCCIKPCRFRLCGVNSRWANK